MPSQHRYPAITPRPDPELRERAKQAVAEMDSSLNGHIIGFLRWLVGDTDELPPRPAHRVPDAPSTPSS
jgi:hypothetical protein